MERMAWMRGARVLIDDCLAVRAGENVLVVGDTTTVKIAEILAYVAAERGAVVTISFIEPTGRHNSEPPPPVAAAMRVADVILLPTSYSTYHTRARREANAAGARIAHLGGVNETLFDGSLDIDLPKAAETVIRVGRLLRESRKIRITSANGSDVRVELCGYGSVDMPGLCREPGTLGSVPNLESAVPPLEGSAEGVWIVDGVMPQAGLLPVREPFRVTFSGGRVTKIEGGRDAEIARSFLESFDDPNVYQLVEVGIGLNPKAKMERSYKESEAEFGTVHLGIGDGTSFGISHRAKVHCDFVARNPTLELDGRVILKDRQLFID